MQHRTSKIVAGAFLAVFLFPGVSYATPTLSTRMLVSSGEEAFDYTEISHGFVDRTLAGTYFPIADSAAFDHAAAYIQVGQGWMRMSGSADGGGVRYADGTGVNWAGSVWLTGEFSDTNTISVACASGTPCQGSIVGSVTVTGTGSTYLGSRWGGADFWWRMGVTNETGGDSAQVYDKSASDLPYTLNYSLAVAFNTPFELITTLQAGASAFPNDYTYEGFWNAGFDLTHTLTWGGFDVYDSYGNIVSDYTITSDSGIDWSQRVAAPSVGAVPEPETYAMLLAGLGLLGFMGRRRMQ